MTNNADKEEKIIADSGLKESPWTDEKKEELSKFIEELRKSRGEYNN